MFETIEMKFIQELVSSILILAGTAFMIIASIGLLRFPDFYIRMSAITKGSTLGVGLILLGMGLYFNEPDIFLKVLIIILFTMLTSPVAAHVIARTAVQNQVPFWKKTNLKEFQEYLDKEMISKENKDEAK